MTGLLALFGAVIVFAGVFGIGSPLEDRLLAIIGGALMISAALLRIGRSRE